ncbi:MAG TPA: NAD-dependent epimerase/dehydratase family protein [Candidatus Acidoferrales bacterium]|nr:NAD-dependent epimerase/dehydratase family protein [Candidatus Acidoferrales bacterium]
MKNKLKVLLLGGSGFVGKNILEQLSSKYIILSPTHQELDLLNEEAVVKFFRKNKPDVVIYAINLGGTRKKQDTADTFSDNLQMFFNVVRCKKYFKKMIFLGSGAEYDKRNPLIKVKETDFDKSIPTDYYGLYKYICSKYIEGSKNIINLRIFGLFGKYEDHTIRFISNAIRNVIDNGSILMNQNVYFDYVYINDFIRILDYFISNKPKYKFYNIGTGKPVDLIKIAQMINKLDGKNKKIIIKKTGLGKDYTCDNSRLIEELPNFSFTPFQKSLKILYQYYSKNK